MVYELLFKLLKEDQKETHHNIMEDQANTKEKQVLLSSTRISVINLLSPGIIWLCLYQRRLSKRWGVWPKHLQVWARIRIQQGDRRGNRNRRTRDPREHSLPGKGYQWTRVSRNVEQVWERQNMHGLERDQDGRATGYRRPQLLPEPR